MRLTHLLLQHFRNLGIQELEIPPEGAAIVGDNAQGKSNLLESIYYLETFRSFRGARDEQLVAFGEDVFRVVGRIECGSGEESGVGGAPEPVEVAAAFQRTGRRKKVALDGMEVERIGDGLGRLGAVIFSPADIELVAGGPAERRRFLDIVLSLNVAGYLESLQRYRHVLSQRNAALREEEPPAVVQAWDETLVKNGARVVRAREAWIRRWAPGFAEYYRTVSGGPSGKMEYRPSVDPAGAESDEKMAAAYREALDESRERERRRQATVVGPHRDEVRIMVEGPGQDEGAGRGDGIDVRAYGSGGQRRTAALALRLVEADTIRDTRHRPPLLLLDDVFAELDPGRGERVLELMQRTDMGQVLLTAPKESDVRVHRDRLPRWRILKGRVEK